MSTRPTASQFEDLVGKLQSSIDANKHLNDLGARDELLSDCPERIGMQVRTRRAVKPTFPGAGGVAEVWETVWSIGPTSGGRFRVRTYNYTYPTVALTDLRVTPEDQR
jgi:hypothetical protein